MLPDNSVRFANLRAGASDITEYLAPTDAATIKSDPRLKLAVSDALGYIGLNNNLTKGPRSDTPYGRNALVRAAVDRPADPRTMRNVSSQSKFRYTAARLAYGGDRANN